MTPIEPTGAGSSESKSAHFISKRPIGRHAPQLIVRHKRGSPFDAFAIFAQRPLARSLSLAAMPRSIYVPSPEGSCMIQAKIISLAVVFLLVGCDESFNQV